jgi:hypothetical protein
MMKLLYSCLFILFISPSFAQTSADAAVQLSVSVSASPLQIVLKWTPNSTTSQYQVYRKIKQATTWGPIMATLPGSASQYTDNTVSTAINYEYRVIRIGSGYTGYGYVNSGINIPETDYRGKLILIIDSTYSGLLNLEISRLKTDIEGDGWEIIRHDVSRNDSVTSIKALIVSDYNIDPINTRAVFLFGHVPVPYSGNINPDGHSDHIGAWPADVYYGDIDGTWTDLFGPGSSTNSPVRTQNFPGDGKFDQSAVPGDVELQVGRVDLANLPAFSLTEAQLLKNYLDKDHEYRKKLYVPLKRAVIDDNFGYFGSEAFAASGYKNFAPLVGQGNVVAADYFTSMAAGSYLWSYGCGGGSYTSASGIGNTTNFSTANLQGTFTMLFGSYFGDWDISNSFLRAPLAQGRVLTSAWSGRPHYQFHHMGLGENIGYSILQTQNNPGNIYFGSPTGITGKWIHNALMGDPTLRNDVVAPVSNVIATRVGFNCNILWSASTETNIVGYNIYMKNDTNKTYVKINTTPITGTTYVDSCLLYKGIYTYMVRALKLENVPSGTYYNMSEGIMDTAMNVNDFTSLAQFTMAIVGNTVSLTPTSTFSATYSWDFGNGSSSSLSSPSVIYGSNGNYVITLIATHACYTDTSVKPVSITEVAINELTDNEEVLIFPNPTTGMIFITTSKNESPTIRIISVDGKKIMEKVLPASGVPIDLSHLQKGIYFVEVISGKEKVVKKLILN